MVEYSDTKLRVLRLAQRGGGAGELRIADPTALVPPRPHRVDPDREDALAAIHGLRRFPLPLELVVRVREARREGVRDVVVAGDDEQRPVERAQELRRGRVLLGLAAMREVAARDDE